MQPWTGPPQIGDLNRDKERAQTPAPHRWQQAYRPCQ